MYIPRKNHLSELSSRLLLQWISIEAKIRELWQSYCQIGSALTLLHLVRLPFHHGSSVLFGM